MNFKKNKKSFIVFGIIISIFVVVIIVSIFKKSNIQSSAPNLSSSHETVKPRKDKRTKTIDLPKSLTPVDDIVEWIDKNVGYTSLNIKNLNNNTCFECETDDYKYIINCPLKETKTIDLPSSLTPRDDIIKWRINNLGADGDFIGWLNNNTRFECETDDYKYIINCPFGNIKTYYRKDDKIIWYIEEFNVQGQKIKEISYQLGSETISSIIEYNNQGEIKMTIYQNDGKTISKIEEYNNQRIPTKTTIYQSDGKTIKSIQEFNNQGIITDEQEAQI